MFVKRSILLVLSLVALAGCTGPTFIVQQYAGTPRASESIAVLRISGGDGPQVVALDGEALPPVYDRSVRMHIEVLPGPHDLEAFAPARGVERPVPLRFVAEAGKMYRLEVRPSHASADRALEASGIAYLYEVDRDTDVPRGPALPEPPPVRDAGR
jgi:hypothetical protein